MAYIEAMQPMVWHEKYNDYLPLLVVYQYVVKQLDENQYEGESKIKAKKMKEEVIGSNWIGDTPDLFWDVGLLIELGVTPLEWRNAKIWNQIDRAKWRAYKFIENMKHTVEQYNDYVKRQLEKIRESASKPDDSKRR